MKVGGGGGAQKGQRRRDRERASRREEELEGRSERAEMYARPGLRQNGAWPPASEYTPSQPQRSDGILLLPSVRRKSPKKSHKSHNQGSECMIIQPCPVSLTWLFFCICNTLSISYAFRGPPPPLLFVDVPIRCNLASSDGFIRLYVMPFATTSSLLVLPLTTICGTPSPENLPLPSSSPGPHACYGSPETTC